MPLFLISSAFLHWTPGRLIASHLLTSHLRLTFNITAIGPLALWARSSCVLRRVFALSGYIQIYKRSIDYGLIPLHVEYSEKYQEINIYERSCSGTLPFSALNQQALLSVVYEHADSICRHQHPSSIDCLGCRCPLRLRLQLWSPRIRKMRHFETKKRMVSAHPPPRRSRS